MKTIPSIIRLTCILLGVLISKAEAFSPDSPCQTTQAEFENTQPTSINDLQTVTSTITVEGLPPVIWDVDLTTFIQHTFPGDLEVTLRSPSGTYVTITTGNGAGNDNVFNGTLWDDSANPDGSVGVTPIAGIVTLHPYQNNVVATPLVPEEGLAAFIGENPNGNWQLTIRDRAQGDFGKLNSWKLRITAQSLITATSTASNYDNNDYNIPEDGSVLTNELDLGGSQSLCNISVRVEILHPSPGDLDLTLLAPNSFKITLSKFIGGSNSDIFSGTSFSPYSDLGSQIPYQGNPAIVSDHVYTNGVAAANLTPQESLGSLFGAPSSGKWKLQIKDNFANGKTGTLTRWGVTRTFCSTPNSDSDNDGTPNVCDACPNDSGKTYPGQCGCSVADTDSDGDGFADCADSCPNDPNKIFAGICGCGIKDQDSDADGTSDCNEQCPFDPNKKAAGACGCGVSDLDSDGDGVADCMDNCPASTIKTDAGKCGCNIADTDSDSDGTADCSDACPLNPGKTSAGACGCNFADSDQNGNGIADCLFTQEFKFQIDSVLKLSKKVQIVQSSNKKKFKVQKLLRQKLKSQLAAIPPFVAASGQSISVKAGVDLMKQTTAAVKKGKKLLTSHGGTLARNKRAAIRALSALKGQVN